jgi:hypothetical protein
VSVLDATGCMPRNLAGRSPGIRRYLKPLSGVFAEAFDAL